MSPELPMSRCLFEAPRWDGSSDLSNKLPPLPLLHLEDIFNLLNIVLNRYIRAAPRGWWHLHAVEHPGSILIEFGLPLESVDALISCEAVASTGKKTASTA